MSKLIAFSSRFYPALTIMAAGRKFKFVGGTLRVHSSEAEIIRRYIAQRPHLKIAEAGVVADPAAPPEDAPVVPSMAMTKTQLLDVAGGMGMAADVLEPLTKREIIAAIEAAASTSFSGS